MTTEEKARRYDEALERARKCLDEKRDTCFVRPDVIFPELAKSEDKRISEGIIKFLIDVNNGAYTKSELKIASWIAWLEKQGEQKSDKVEPKFHEGDFIVNKDGNTYKVVDVCDVIENNYRLRRLSDNGFVQANVSVVDRQSRLWTIQDAKPCDVIYLPNGNNEYYFFIFKGIENAAVMTFSHFYQYNDGTSEVEGTIDNLFSVNDVFHPATKEQRELLFEKMCEAGYKFDTEKKELMEIK